MSGCTAYGVDVVPKPPQITQAEAFGLKSFSDLLPARGRILGEAPVSFEAFQAALSASLAPATPHEALIAENLVAIEWEILQQRRMRDASLRKNLHARIVKAVINARSSSTSIPDIALEFPMWPGEGTDDEEAQDVAARATSGDATLQTEAENDLVGMGLDPVALLADAYRRDDKSTMLHDAILADLERRRRDVKRDYDALQAARPIEAEVVEE